MSEIYTSDTFSVSKSAFDSSTGSQTPRQPHFGGRPGLASDPEVSRRWEGHGPAVRDPSRRWPSGRAYSSASGCAKFLSYDAGADPAECRPSGGEGAVQAASLGYRRAPASSIWELTEGGPKGAVSEDVEALSMAVFLAEPGLRGLQQRPRWNS